MNYWKIIAPILVGILVYTILGFIFLSTGTTIYDDFPIGNFTLNEYTPHTITIRNNALFTFPFVNPSFKVLININPSRQVSCFVKTGKGSLSCGGALVDLGYIPAGDGKDVKVTIMPNTNGFTLQINAYLNFLSDIVAKSKNLKCVNQGHNPLGDILYSCE